MKLSDAIKQLRKGYNLTNFQQAELLESLSNNGGEDPANSVSVLDLGVDGDPDIKWEDIQKVDAIRIGGEGESIILLKAPSSGSDLTFYGQADDTIFIKLTFHNIDGKGKIYESTFGSYREISSVIEGVGDTETALSTLGANNLLHGKADLVNGLVPAAQLPSYVDDVVDFNGFTPNIVDVAEEDAILNYPANTKWVCTATVEPFKSKYHQKILYVNANTSKEDWTIIEPEKNKIYINIGADGDAVNGDTFRWSGTAWVDLNQNLKEKLTAVEKKLIVLNLGTIADVNDLSTIDQSILNDLNTFFTSSIYTFSQAIFIFRSVSGIYNKINIQSIKYQDKEVSFILPNGQIDTYKLVGTASTNYTFTKISSTGIVVTLDESELNKTYTDEAFKAKLKNTTKLIVKNINDNINEFHRGNSGGDIVYYINTSSTSGASVITFSKTSGRLSGVSYVSFAPDALFYTDYTSAGGSLSKSELNTWLADASSTHIVVVPDSQLGKVVTDDSLKAKLENAGLLIISRSNNYQIVLKSVGNTVNNIHSFVGASTNTSFQQVNYNILTGELSSLINMSNTAYSEYHAIGGPLTEVAFNDWYSKAPSSTLFISRSDIGVALEESKDTLIKGSSVIVILDPDGTKSPVPCFRTSTENDNYIWYGWLNASTVERLSYNATTRQFAIANMQIGKDSLDSRIMNLPYSQLGAAVSNEVAQRIESSSAIILTTTDTNDPYNKVMFTRASTSATEIKFVNPTITGSSYTVEYITFNPETNSLSSINV